MASLLTNTSAMVALQNIRKISSDLSTVQEQISTGKKVGSARDNAAVFAITTIMNSDVKGFEAISGSLNLGSASVGVASGAAETITSLLTDMKGLIVAAQEDNVDRSKIQTDVAQLRNQINSIVNAASFNGLSLVKGAGSVDFLASLDRDSGGSVTASAISVTRQNLETAAGVGVAGLDATTTGVNGGGTAAAALVADTNTFALDIDVAATFTAGDTYEVKIDGRKFVYEVATGDDHDDVGQGITNLITAAGITGVAAVFTAGGAADAQVDITNTTGGTVAIEANATDGSGGGLGNLTALDVSTAGGASTALVTIEGLIQTAVDASAAFGSSISRIDIQLTFVSDLTDSLKTGIGALVDADLEEASARLQSLQVQQQLGIQSLSIASQSSQNVLSLFR